MYRVGGLIIRGKKVLLVSNEHSEAFWTPGGRIEPGEEPDIALRRELQEEIGLTRCRLTYYASFEGNHDELPGKPLTFGYFLVHTREVPQPSGDEVTKLDWFSAEDIRTRKVTRVVDTLLAKRLIADGLIA